MSDSIQPATGRKRQDLAAIDVCFIFIGLFGAVGTVPALNEVLPDDFVDLLCLALVLFGGIALFGVLKEALWLELVSKLCIFGGFFAYIVVLLIVIFLIPEPTSSGGPGLGRLYVLPGVVIPMIVIADRLPFLVKKAAKAKAERELRLEKARQAALECEGNER